MIYITGDCHGDFRRFRMENFPEQRQMTKEDYVIICGDFGGVWSVGEESREEKWWLDWLEGRSFTTLFVDGNHENFDRLNAYPEEVWQGGRVHRIRPSVLHLMRGQVFTIDGLRIFSFGGAASHDISGGILDPADPHLGDKKKRLRRLGKPFRVNRVSWWEEELASGEEMEEGRRNLQKCGMEVELIVSHCCAESIQKQLGDEYVSDRETEYLEEVKRTCRYGVWFCGHYHDNRRVGEREIAVYEQIVRVR